MGVFGPSLLIESTDSMILLVWFIYISYISCTTVCLIKGDPWVVHLRSGTFPGNNIIRTVDNTRQVLK